MTLTTVKPSNHTANSPLTSILFLPFSLSLYVIRKAAQLIYFLAAALVRIIAAPFVWAYGFFSKPKPFSKRSALISSNYTPITSSETLALAEQPIDGHNKHKDNTASGSSPVKPMTKAIHSGEIRPSAGPGSSPYNSKTDAAATHTGVVDATDSKAGAGTSQSVGSNQESVASSSTQNINQVSGGRMKSRNRADRKVVPETTFVIGRILQMLPELTLYKIEHHGSRKNETFHRIDAGDGGVMLVITKDDEKIIGQEFSPLSKDNPQDIALSHFLTSASYLLGFWLFSLDLAEHAVSERMKKNELDSNKGSAMFQKFLDEIGPRTGANIRKFLTNGDVSSDKLKYALSNLTSKYGLDLKNDQVLKRLRVYQQFFAGLAPAAGKSDPSAPVSLDVLHAPLDALANLKTGINLFGGDLDIVLNRPRSIVTERDKTFSAFAQYVISNVKNLHKKDLASYFCALSTKVRKYDLLSQESRSSTPSIDSWENFLQTQLKPRVPLSPIQEGNDEALSETDSVHSDDTAGTHNTFGSMITNAATQMFSSFFASNTHEPPLGSGSDEGEQEDNDSDNVTIPTSPNNR